MTISESLKFASNQLKTGHINNPPLEAEILLSSILKKPRQFLLAHGEKRLFKKQTVKFQWLLKRRLRGEPAAYLTGRKEFYGLDFMVNKNVLIPRPETELMVEETMELVTHNSQLTTFVDVGTGSGCIIVTLTKLLNQKSGIINHKLIGIDISIKALSVAQKNARLHKVSNKIKFIKGDLLTPIIHNSSFIIPNSLIILANLPYGWLAWKNNCSIDTVGLKFEPEVALFTDENGLGLYEKLFKQIKNLLVAGRRSRAISALCEFDPRQATKIKQLIKQELPLANCRIKKDLSGLNRLAIITIPGQRAS